MKPSPRWWHSWKLRPAHSDRLRRPRYPSSLDHPLGDAIETFIRREDAERFIDEVRGNEPVIAAKLRIEQRELDAVRLN
jgi:hypothetical protein